MLVLIEFLGSENNFISRIEWCVFAKRQNLKDGGLMLSLQKWSSLKLRRHNSWRWVIVRRMLRELESKDLQKTSLENKEYLAIYSGHLEKWHTSSSLKIKFSFSIVSNEAFIAAISFGLDICSALHNPWYGIYLKYPSPEAVSNVLANVIHHIYISSSIDLRNWNGSIQMSVVQVLWSYSRIYNLIYSPWGQYS